MMMMMMMIQRERERERIYSEEFSINNIWGRFLNNNNSSSSSTIFRVIFLFSTNTCINIRAHIYNFKFCYNFIMQIDMLFLFSCVFWCSYVLMKSESWVCSTIYKTKQKKAYYICYENNSLLIIIRYGVLQANKKGDQIICIYAERFLILLYLA